MENEKQNAVEAMLAQYAANNKPTPTKKEGTSGDYDLKNYYAPHLGDGVDSKIDDIRILPTADGSSPFVEMWVHNVKVGDEKGKKKFPCLAKEKDQACPLCEARAALLSTGKDSDKELAKKYSPRKYYVVKVILRGAEDEGVKFWRFNDDYRKAGIFDKLNGLILSLKTKQDVTDPNEGRDLSISISRRPDGYPVVQSITAQDSTVLTEDTTMGKEWLADARTWEDKIYALRDYDYLEIVTKGGTPMFDKEAKKFVDKASLDAKPSASTTDDLDSELKIGGELKNDVTEAASTEAPASEESDDLPF